MDYKEIKNILEDKNIRASTIRVKILDLLYRDKNHLSTDEIYNKLSREVDTLSKTSIYNNTKLFEENNLIKRLDLGDGELRYEAKLEEHGHFLCKNCKSIYDIYLDDIKYIPKELEGFKIDEKYLLYEGICLECISK